MKILLLTQGSQGIVALRELFSSGKKPDEISIYICDTQGNKPLIEFLNYCNLNYKYFNNQDEFNNFITNNHDDFDVIISVSWKYIFSKAVVLLFKGKLINLHPGLLPQYRGCFSTPWSIINNEKHVGYTYHYIDEGIDTGSILIQDKIQIDPIDTAFSLNYKLMQIALSKLNNVVDMVISGNSGRKQGEGGIYYANKLPFDGLIKNDWDCEKKERFVRAMYFPPMVGAIEIIDGKEIEIKPRQTND